MKDLSSSQISQMNPLFWQLSTLKHFIWCLLMLRQTKFFLVWAKQPLQRIDKVPGSHLLSQQVKFSLRNTLISKKWQIIQKSKARYLSRPFPSPRDGIHVPSQNQGRQKLSQDTMLQQCWRKLSRFACHSIVLFCPLPHAHQSKLNLQRKDI